MVFFKKLTKKKILILILAFILIYPLVKPAVPRSSIKSQTIYRFEDLWEKNIIYDEAKNMLIFQDDHSLMGLNLESNEVNLLVQKIEVGGIRGHVPGKLVILETGGGKRYSIYRLDNGRVIEANVPIPRYNKENSLIDSHLKELFSKSEKLYYGQSGRYTTYIFEQGDSYTIIGRYDAQEPPGTIQKEKIFFGHLDNPINVFSQRHHGREQEKYYGIKQNFTSKDKQYSAILEDIVYRNRSTLTGRDIRSYNQITVLKSGKEVGRVYEDLGHSKGFLFFPGNSSRIYYWGTVGFDDQRLKMIELSEL